MSEFDVGQLFTLLTHLRDGDNDAALTVWPKAAQEQEALLTLLRDNRLLGHFYWLAASGPLPGQLPVQALTELQDAYVTQAECARQNLQLLSELKQYFVAGGIEFVALKGLYISERFFGDVSSRFMWDLDILVPPDELQAAVGEAGRVGLVPRSRTCVDPGDTRLGIHALELKGKRGKLDIHIALRNLPGINIDLGLQRQQARDYEINGLSVPCASDEDTLFLSCLGLATDLQRGQYNLRKIWDVCIMLRQMDDTTDWQAFLSAREGEGALQLVLNCCALVIHLTACAQSCPRLVLALEQRAGLILIASAEEALALYRRGRDPLRNRRLFSRLLPVSAWTYWLQVLRGMPARRRYYRETGRKR